MDKKICFNIKDMNLFYGEFHALKNITMQLHKGEVSAFIGPSGCGKSTFLKSLNRMNDLVENCKIKGKILFFGENIYKKYNVNVLRKKVGMVFQKPNPFPLSIYENLVFGPKTHGITQRDKLDSIVEECLKDVGLWKDLKDRLKQSALSLSGGQQQRLCIARTLAVNPEVILMDEPTSALDPLSTLKIEELISKLKKNYTIIIVTHNMQQAHRISDKVAFFLLGEMIEFDSAQKIFNNPKNTKTKDYIEGRFG
ncbi:phosphate ABC transporter ATP-binding protein [Helicobacter aurati]|uniref:Phosphate ABC transporter ATP-binding protein n=1 Tax=Helicobacter aurati TaxID=137778 RepID=A0A3D8J8I9_9HELI|nr:phosphate ABC transporter ATP-binding protein PstB [Helicobacter aurati]RDU73819.1 phosphate ABC transporter ATP-binding protein [Helicobacter aurati]